VSLVPMGYFTALRFDRLAAASLQRLSCLIGRHRSRCCLKEYDADRFDR